MIKEVLENLEDIKENQKCLEEEVKEIRSKINIFANQQTPPQKKLKENNIKLIIEYLEKLQLPSEYGSNPNKWENKQNKKQNIKNVRKPVKPTKNRLS